MSTIPFRVRLAALTKRQRQVVRLVSLGCSVSDIAKILGIARATVDNHKGRAMRILGVRKAAELTRLAIKHRIAPMADRLTPDELQKIGRRPKGKAA